MALPIRITERIRLDRPPAQVWPYVAVPELYAKWNPKLTHSEAQDAFYTGMRFTAHYKMGQNQVQCLTEVAAVEPEKRLFLRHFNAMGAQRVPQNLEATEEVLLEPRRNGGTLVIKKIVIRHHGLPWPVMPLIWLVTSLGKPVRANPLKSLVESGPRL